MLRALSVIPASATSGSSRLPPAASSEYAVWNCSARASSSAFLVVPVPVQRHRRDVRAAGDRMHGGRLQPLLTGQPERGSQHRLRLSM